MSMVSSSKNHIQSDCSIYFKLSWKYQKFYVLIIDDMNLYFFSPRLGKNQLVGDMLCLGGAVLFSVITVLQELAVKTVDIIEYLGMIGFFGTILSCTQV